MSYLGFCPPGVVLPFAGLTAPDGWLLCDGSAVDQSTYSALYNAIGATYNTQVNPTTGSAWAAPTAGQFRVPDYRGVFLRGTGTASGGDSTALGGHQNQKTAKNGLAASASSVSVSGLKNQMNGGTGGVSQNHYHGIGGDGFHDHAIQASGLLSAGGSSYGVIGNVGPTRSGGSGSHSHGGGTGYISNDHGHSWDFGGAAQFTAAGTAVAQAIAGDNETRPVNKGINYIIKI